MSHLAIFTGQMQRWRLQQKQCQVMSGEEWECDFASQRWKLRLLGSLLQAAVTATNRKESMVSNPPALLRKEESLMSIKGALDCRNVERKHD